MPGEGRGPGTATPSFSRPRGFVPEDAFRQAGGCQDSGGLPSPGLWLLGAQGNFPDGGAILFLGLDLCVCSVCENVSHTSMEML